MEDDDKGDRLLLMLLGSDRSARRSEAARRDGDDTCTEGGEDTPGVRSCAMSSFAPDCFRLFLPSAPFFLIPSVSLAEEDDGPPPRPLDGRGELSIAYCLQHETDASFSCQVQCKTSLYPGTTPKMTHRKLDGFKMLLSYWHHRLHSTPLAYSL